MEFRMTRREMLAGGLAGVWFVCMATGCTTDAPAKDSNASVSQAVDRGALAVANVAKSNLESATAQGVGTPYESLLTSSDDIVDMTVTELNDLASSCNLTQFKVRGLVTDTDTNWESKMYSPVNAEPSEYIAVDYTGGIWPHITETEEMELYLKPESFYKNVVTCVGSTEPFEECTDTVAVDFDDMRSMVEAIFSKSVRVDGYISLSSAQDKKSGYELYYLYQDAKSLIGGRLDSAFAVELEKGTEVAEGSAVRVEIPSLSDVIGGRTPHARVIGSL